MLSLSQRLTNIARIAKAKHQPRNWAEEEQAHAKAGTLAEGLGQLLRFDAVKHGHHNHARKQQNRLPGRQPCRIPSGSPVDCNVQSAIYKAKESVPAQPVLDVVIVERND